MYGGGALQPWKYLFNIPAIYKCKLRCPWLSIINLLSWSSTLALEMGALVNVTSHILSVTQKCDTPPREILTFRSEPVNIVV